MCVCGGGTLKAYLILVAYLPYLNTKSRSGVKLKELRGYFVPLYRYTEREREWNIHIHNSSSNDSKFSFVLLSFTVNLTQAETRREKHDYILHDEKNLSNKTCFRYIAIIEFDKIIEYSKRIWLSYHLMWNCFQCSSSKYLSAICDIQECKSLITTCKIPRHLGCTT